MHWTLDHAAHTSGWDFRQAVSEPLAQSLSATPIDPTADRKMHRYTVLPNFWSGYNADARHGPLLAFGELSIDRSRTDRGDWIYQVEHINEASGEALSLDFVCGNEPNRPLRSPWQIAAQNSADGDYTSISWTGEYSVESERCSITLTTARGMSIPAGDADRASDLTCNWALVDILPSLGARVLDGLTILDDLEVLKPNCQIRPLEGWSFAAGAARYPLKESWLNNIPLCLSRRNRPIVPWG